MKKLNTFESNNAKWKPYLCKRISINFDSVDELISAHLRLALWQTSRACLRFERTRITQPAIIFKQEQRRRQKPAGKRHITTYSHQTTRNGSNTGANYRSPLIKRISTHSIDSFQLIQLLQRIRHFGSFCNKSMAAISHLIDFLLNHWAACRRAVTGPGPDRRRPGWVVTLELCSAATSGTSIPRTGVDRDGTQSRSVREAPTQVEP